MQRTILLLTFLIAVCCGCQRPRSDNSRRITPLEPAWHVGSDTNDQITAKQATNRDAAAACAIIHVFENTPRLHESGEFGALFFEGISREALSIVSSHLNVKLRMELGTKNLQLPKFVDRLTGQKGMIIHLVMKPKTSRTYSVGVVRGFGELGAHGYSLDVTFVDGEWQVTRFEKGGVA
jgi:hypothetical protein